jgi:hypothetical protein
VAQLPTNTTITESRFDYASVRLSALSVSKQQWPTVVCLVGFLCFSSESLAARQRCLTFICVFFPLQSSNCTLRRVEFN